MHFSADKDTGRASATTVLSEHHGALDQQLDKLMSRAREEDPVELREEWGAFERQLSRHMELEEAEILPAFAKTDPAEAHALLSEHCAIRNAMLDMGLNLDLHCLRAEAVDDFVLKLRAHAKREDAALYPWSQTHLPAGGWQSIKRGLKSASKTGRRLLRLTDKVM
jgi:hemerythrin-like domain-containing protein